MEKRAVAQVLIERGITQIYGYVRKSREVTMQEAQKHHDILKAYADQLGLPIKIFFEVDSSETLNRPELNKVMEMVRNGQIRALMVYRLDRVTRKTTDNERLVGELNFNDIVLIEADREKIVDYKEALGIKLEAIMSDLYLEQAKMVLLAGRKKAVQLYGSHLGIAPLGYDYDKASKKLVPNEKAIVVKTIFQKCLEGKGTKTIALEVNAMGFRTLNGKPFESSTVWSTLNNLKYKGVQIFGKTQWWKDGEGKSHHKPRDPEGWIVFEDAHEPIVDPEIYEKAQQILKENKATPHRSRVRAYPLTGIVRCGICGKVMTFVRKGDKIYHSPCTKLDYTTGKKCKNSARSYKEIDDFVRHQLWFVARPIILDMNEKIAQDPKAYGKKGFDDEIKNLQKEVNQIDVKLDNLLDLQLARGVDERLLQKEKELIAHKKAIMDRIKDLQEQNSVNTGDWFDKWVELSQALLSFPLIWEHGTAEQKNILVKKYIKEVIHVSGEPLKVVWADVIQTALE